MIRTLGRLRLLFLCLFAIGAVAVGVHQWFWVRPQRACEARFRWWHAESRSCGIPVFIPDFTGRAPPEGVKRPPNPHGPY